MCLLLKYGSWKLWLEWWNANHESLNRILKLTIKTPERRHWRRSDVFIVNFEHNSHLVLVFLLLTLGRYMPVGIIYICFDIIWNKTFRDHLLQILNKGLLFTLFYKPERFLPNLSIMQHDKVFKRYYKELYLKSFCLLKSDSSNLPYT